MQREAPSTPVERPVLERHVCGVAVAAGLFSAVVLVLMVATFVQLEAHDPLDSEALDSLRHRLREDPADERLADEIRALHLIARKAYFTSRWQLASGAWMLLAGLVVLLGALRWQSSLHARWVVPDEGTARARVVWYEQERTRRWLGASAVTVLVFAVAVSVLSRDELSSDPAQTAGSAGPSREEVLANWATFRGPGSLGVAAASEAPTDWDGAAGRGVAWKVEVPLPGYSSPVVWKGRVYLTGADRTRREVYCFDADSGELRWRHDASDVPGSPDKPPRVHNDTGYAPSTVAVDGRRVFAIFPTGDLVGLDLDGTRLWAQNLGVPDNHYGHASSLVTHGRLLLVQFDQRTGSQLLALDTATGATVWRAARGTISWSSPILIEHGGRTQLVLTDSSSVKAYDPTDGRQLWGHDCMRGEMGPSAAFADGWVFAANDFAVVAGIRLTDNGSELVWTSEEHLPDTSSPVATERHLFLATSYGVLACLDVATGELVWEHDYGLGFYASPILVGDRLYALDLDGVMHIVRAGEVFESLAEPQLGEPSACTPAIVGGRIFVRGERHLFCITGA